MKKNITPSLIFASVEENIKADEIKPIVNPNPLIRLGEIPVWIKKGVIKNDTLRYKNSKIGDSEIPV